MDFYASEKLGQILNRKWQFFNETSFYSIELMNKSQDIFDLSSNNFLTNFYILRLSIS